jgi:hypothetical protein
MMTPTARIRFVCEIEHENGATIELQERLEVGGWNAWQYAKRMGVGISEATVLRQTKERAYLVPDQRKVLRDLAPAEKKRVHAECSPVIKVYLKIKRIK